MLIIVSRVQRVQVVAEGRQGLGATTGSTAIKPNTFPKITDSRPLSLQQVSTVRAESHQEKSVAFLWLFAETHFNLHSRDGLALPPASNQSSCLSLRR